LLYLLLGGVWVQDGSNFLDVLADCTLGMKRSGIDSQKRLYFPHMPLESFMQVKRLRA